MKPEKLILSGWGPYKEQAEVDFTRFKERGLFLITGATGAGKTTIFDAITYALYGNMSGDVREKNSVRSDFADGDTPTFVELWMQHGGKMYHIIRNPEYMRPKKKKGGKSDVTKEKENARLYLPDGSAVEGSSEVNRRLQELLVLDYRQFKQISMIAQGEFARLLTAEPSEKTKIFREIFATSIYDSFAGVLRRRSTDLYKQVAEYRHRMEEDVHILREGLEARIDEEEKATDCEKYDDLNKIPQEENHSYEKLILWLEERISFDGKRLETVQTDYSRLETEMAKLTGQVSLAQQLNAKLCRLEELKLQKQQLEEQRQEAEAAKQELERAKKADAVKEIYIHLNHVRKQAASMKQKGEEDHTALEQQLVKAKSLELYEKEKEEIQNGYACLADYEETRKRRMETERKTAQKQEQLMLLQQCYIEQEQNTQEKKAAYEQADSAYKRAVVGLAARQVREGEPCPVCGSMEHPHIASWEDGVPDEKSLQDMQKRYEKEQEQLTQIHGKAAACRGELTACKAQLRQNLEQEESLRLQKEKMRPGICEILAQMSQTEYEKVRTQYHELQAQIKEKESRLAADEAEYKQQEELCRQQEAEFVRQYQEAGFASAKAYELALRSAKQQSELEARIKDFYARMQSIEDLTMHLKEETKGAKRADTEKLRTVLEEKQRKKQQVLKQLNVCTHQLEEEKKIVKSLQEKEKQLQKLLHEYGIVKDLDDMASGNNARRLVFEQYVLAGYFEEILRAANVRLAKMTGNRYELSRLEEISDGRTKDNLEIRVLDYYTGKYRSVKTLSGGESFKASLALALGMSDVIQGYSGGIRVDTLFIDEGFGALDSESMDMACQTLQSLVEKERLIGIISHVPELAEKIEHQIIVTKTKAGSQIQTVV